MAVPKRARFSSSASFTFQIIHPNNNFNQGAFMYHELKGRASCTRTIFVSGVIISQVTEEAKERCDVDSGRGSLLWNPKFILDEHPKATFYSYRHSKFPNRV